MNSETSPAFLNPNSPLAPLVLITGCNGLVGSFVAGKFVAEGYRVRGLRRSGSDLRLVAAFSDRLEWAEGDVLDIPSLEKALVGVHLVVHAAALVSFAPSDRARLYRVNVEGTANVVNCCLKAGVPKFCHVSSVAALGQSGPGIIDAQNQRPEMVTDEEVKWEESPRTGHYARSKYLAELEVWRGQAEGLKVVVVNPSLVLGVGDWNRSSARVFKYLWDEKPFYPPGSVNYVDVRDVAEIIFLLTSADIRAERYILSAGSIAYRELFDQIADGFRKLRPRIRVGIAAAELLWRLEWVRSRLSGKAPLINRETVRIASRPLRYDNRKIRGELNYVFRSIDDTVRWCCREFVEMENKSKQPTPVRDEPPKREPDQDTHS